MYIRMYWYDRLQLHAFTLNIQKKKKKIKDGQVSNEGKKNC